MQQERPTGIQTPNGSVQPAPVSQEPLLGSLHTQFSDRLSEALRTLPAREFVFIDANLNIFESKSPFLKGEAQPLASLRKEVDGNFTVYPGLPPRNQTYCGSGTPSHPVFIEAGPPLTSPIVLNSGDWISLTSLLPVPIPNTRPDDGSNPAQALAQLIYDARIGDQVILGRISLQEPVRNACPDIVSRAHITIRIEGRNELPDGTVNIRVRATPGMVSEQTTGIVNPDGSTSYISGTRVVAPGTTLQLGSPDARVTLPHPPNSVGEVSIQISQSIAESNLAAASNSLATFLGENQRPRYAKGVEHMERQRHASPDILVKANLLESYIRDALVMIRDGRSVDAINHLSKPETLQFVGYDFGVGRIALLPAVTKEAVRKNLCQVAENSWFKLDRKLVSPCRGMLLKGVEPQNTEEQNLLDRWHKELALIYAEEYTHALQHLMRAPVSRTAAVIFDKERYYIGNFDHEADVALFFFEQGINLSYEFTRSRYQSRMQALLQAQGVQTKEEQLALQEQVLAAPLDTWVSLRDAVYVKRTTQGEFLVKPIASSATAFVPDSSGYYSRLQDPVTLASGTPLYLGSNFRFELP